MCTCAVTATHSRLGLPGRPGEEGGPGQAPGGLSPDAWERSQLRRGVSWGVRRLGEDPRTQEAGSGDLGSACSRRAVGPVPVSSCVCLQAALSVLTLAESRYPWCHGPRFAVGLFPVEGGDEAFPRQPRTGTSRWALPLSSGCGEACVVLCGRVTSQVRGDLPGTREETPGAAGLVPAGRHPCSPRLSRGLRDGSASCHPSSRAPALEMGCATGYLRPTVPGSPENAAGLSPTPAGVPGGCPLPLPPAEEGVGHRPGSPTAQAHLVHPAPTGTAGPQAEACVGSGPGRGGVAAWGRGAACMGAQAAVSGSPFPIASLRLSLCSFILRHPWAPGSRSPFTKKA